MPDNEKHREKTNASQFPRVYYARHMQPGIAKYDNETILVDTEGMKSLIASGAGKPVYINHQNVDLKLLKEQAAGYISDSFYNELDGWAWFKFIAVDDAAHEAVSKGWSVSNAYMPTEWGNGGTKNNCPYNREVRAGEFTHLAIVPDPRYEDALIMTPDDFKTYQDNLKNKLAELQNSNSKGIPMFKFFKTKKEEVSASEIDKETIIELPDGTSVKVEEMVNAVANAKKNEKEKEEKEMENGDMEVDVQGEKMPLKELVNKYCKMNEKKNETESEEEEEEKETLAEKKNKKVKKNRAEKKNETDDENMEEDEGVSNKEKKNSSDSEDEGQKFFNELRNANRKQETAIPLIETSMTQRERAKKRYGK